MSELYRDFIDQKADQIINSLGGAITPPPPNTELYRDFLDRKFDDVINAIGNVKVKSFTYIGTGALERTITFPEIPKLFAIFSGRGRSQLCAWSITRYPAVERDANYGQSPWVQVAEFSYNNTDKQLTMKATSEIYNLNVIGGDFTVYYI